MALAYGKLALASALAAAAILAPSQQAAAQAVVQAVPPPALGELQAALRILAREPHNQSALLRAAWASIELEDIAAAEGYLRRAEAINPANGEISAGLATIALRRGDPIAAIGSPWRSAIVARPAVTSPFAGLTASARRR